jgi:hypothetical protein
MKDTFIWSELTFGRHQSRDIERVPATLGPYVC